MMQRQRFEIHHCNSSLVTKMLTAVVYEAIAPVNPRHIGRSGSAGSPNRAVVFKAKHSTRDAADPFTNRR